MNPPRDVLRTGLAWYKPDQWRQLREVSSDNLEERYEDWLATATKLLRDLKEKGVEPDLIEVDIDDLVIWCAAKGQKIDASARSTYVSEKLREKYETKL